jgi:DNA polymerase III delta prime subunit
VPFSSSSAARKLDGEPLQVPCSAGHGQRSLETPSKNDIFPDSKKSSEADGGSHALQRVELLEVDPNLDRRKRRKSNLHESEPAADQSIEVNSKAEGCMPSDQALQNAEGEIVDRVYGEPLTSSDPANFQFSSPLIVSVTSQTLMEIDNPILPGTDPAQPLDNQFHDTIRANLDTPNNESSLSDAQKPQKVLRLNSKTGTIGSPPTKKATRNVTDSGKKTSVWKASRQPKTLIVTIKYGHNVASRSHMGQTINQMLNGTKPSPLPSTSCKPAKTGQKAATLKSTHPFFLGKVMPILSSDAADTAVETIHIEPKHTPKKTSMTLGEARSHSPIKQRGQSATTAPVFHNFGNASRILKFAGAVEPCWPPADMVHIRGSPIRRVSPTNAAPPKAAFSSEKKSKYTAIEPVAKDSILQIAASNLDLNRVLEDIQESDLDGFTEPERCLRIPKKHFESGIQIQRRVRRELSVQHQLSIRTSTKKDSHSSSEDELQGGGKGRETIHPAILKVHDAIPTSLTAFDRSEYETQSWIHKYAPSAAAEVLQVGRESFILKDWMQALMVVSVEKGTPESSSQSISVAPRSDKLEKRKRKSNKLEGFIISSDEDDDDLDEISDPEEQPLSHTRHGQHKKTVIRSGRTAQKLKNAVVISGPHGCGKTAMVYAVARELGFEVFEINSSSRRSGKEVLERVGDMTRNHLVHPSHSHNPSNSQDEVQEISDALAADIKSGRQGTMNSFFKPQKKANSNTPAKLLSKARKKKDHETTPRRPLKTTNKQQKQSLILLEEVDILFDEDKQFWATVMNLIAQSKRPVIMTCNDETVVPLQALALHAIIRLPPPLLDIAVDYMLVVAASEGHIVKRKAVKALYESRGYDLRASLTELDYWCQLGIGDLKGGLDWYYPRWPPGCDVDDHGNTIRVVSEDTYKYGMGWLGRDYLFGREEKPQVKEELLREACSSWELDIGNLQESLPLPHHNGETDSILASLSLYETFTDTLSVADICARGSLAPGNQVSHASTIYFLDSNTSKISLDTTCPPITAKVRDDYILGYELLQADLRPPFDTLEREISIWMHNQSRSFSHYQQDNEHTRPFSYHITSHIATRNRPPSNLPLTRHDLSAAFDPIASAPEKVTLQSTTSSLEPSVFDRTTTLICLDVAPYIRSIVAYDATLAAERARLSNLLSEGGGNRKGKRLRTTRSALSALEGGARRTTRREKYFRVPLNPYLIARTGKEEWREAVGREMEISKAVGTEGGGGTGDVVKEDGSVGLGSSQETADSL